MNSAENRLLKHTEDLTKTYLLGTIAVHALRGITMNVREGEFVVLMGSSGSGKSTLLSLLGCLDRPTGGRYLLDGEEVSSLSSVELARTRSKRIGFIFQTFNLLPRMSALDNVILPLLYQRNVTDAEAQHRAREVLEWVGLDDRMAHRPTELSGGQRQRVAIARALVSNPALVLADEPTGNLDSETGLQIIRLLQKMHADGRTILMVTHDPEVASIAEKILHIRDGSLVDGR
ncbi:MAG: ABC transporter ATP-binding protein [Anaerolineales bacterium]|nr:ABC transporter ATP-binding protein [Anaerolineales bacterium]